MGGGCDLKKKNITEGFRAMVGIKVSLSCVRDCHVEAYSIGSWINEARGHIMASLDQS